MNILLISECSKQALDHTRRIIDQFAERKGERTWQTAITADGLGTLRQLLRKTARRNTAVACHWIKAGGVSELLWIVGNLRKFNHDGSVPTNTTQRDILRSSDENQWQTAESIALLAGIAGLFHDFGKANRLFQDKLNPKKKSKSSEPYRHEWVSLRLFQAFVGEDGDVQWLERLKVVSPAFEADVLARLIKDAPTQKPFINPFHPQKGLRTPLAQTIGWLIVSHHRLPKFSQASDAPPLREMDQWMTGSRFNPAWNSPQCQYDDWKTSDWERVWQFDSGTPLCSQKWCDKANSLAKRAIKHRQLQEIDWLQDPFSSHLARLTLMLADHCYSAGEAKTHWQDPKYKAFANTDPKTRELKQKLDEHNVGVGHNAVLLAKSLPKLRQTLPAITRHKGFKQRATNDKYRWQDKAYDLAKGLASASSSQGFFGVNMASTGCGKTFANARIMYGLADEKLGCRFSVALGLRTLTLQTGDALRKRLHLESDDLAVLIGSQAVRQLHELKRESASDDAEPSQAAQSGSESAEALFAEHQYVRYDGSLDDGRLSQWLKQSSSLHQLLSAPVLVSTIDHLMPATEGERGGKQIAPMLRLLTSDLVLDEPDDFDLADLPALCRLVNWAGMLGSRVLLSSATLPPQLVGALFEAYCAGRIVFNATRGNTNQGICCAWFDENKAAHSEHADLQHFAIAHQQFVTQRISALAKHVVLRQAALWRVAAASQTTLAVKQAMSDAIASAIVQLHAEHHQIHPITGQRFSIGLVRMANINPLVAVAQHLLSQPAVEQSRLHFCIYHSQHPLLVRSAMEKHVDAMLTRHDENQLWRLPAIHAAQQCPEPNQIFIVFATAVAEVGRDHDYDWAVAEPSSMRSLIQLAGRIQRHRQREPKTPNLLILHKNYKALKGDAVAYAKPGFESEKFPLASKDLADILQPEQYQKISAAPRIQPRSPLDAQHNLVDLEHAHLAARLFGEAQPYAKLWWAWQQDGGRNPSWCAELQRRMPFRASGKDETFVLLLEEEGDAPQFHLRGETGELKLADQLRFARYEMTLGVGVQPWLDNDAAALIENLAELEGRTLSDTSQKFAEIRLRENDQKWRYHPWFGVHGELD